MRHAMLVGSALAFALLASGAGAAELKSGPEVGKQLPGPFHPLNIFNAENASQSGKKYCLV
jgi:hypothetical protein